MAVDRVSDVFAYVCAHAELTHEILLSQDEPPELTESERGAVADVLGHVRESWIGALSACRDDLWERADTELRTTLEKNWNRDDSIWSRRRVEIPLLIRSTYVEAAYIWLDEEDSRKGQLSLVGEIGVQARLRQKLLEALPDPLPGGVVLSDETNLRVVVPIEEGRTFKELAKSVVEPLWPLALAVRAALMAPG